MSGELMRDVSPDSVAYIEGMYGKMVAREYGAMYASRQNRVDDFIHRLEEANATEFVKLASYAITESARMNGFRGNFEDVHVMATVASVISDTMLLADCHFHNLYERAWRRAFRMNGHETTDPECTCSKEDEQHKFDQQGVSGYEL